MKCYCGKEFYGKPCNFTRNKHTVSCGCCAKEISSKIHSIDITGKKFNKLTALKREGKDKKGRLLWLFKCDCGKEVVKPGNYVTSKSNPVRSCGCIVKSGDMHWKGYEEISGTYWHSVQEGAKKRNLEFNISLKQAWRKFIKQDKKCALTGCSIKFVRKYGNSEMGEQTASLDRIDSKKGYTVKNTQWVHKTVNLMKTNLQESEFITMCKKVFENCRY